MGEVLRAEARSGLPSIGVWPWVHGGGLTHQSTIHSFTHGLACAQQPDDEQVQGAEPKGQSLKGAGPKGQSLKGAGP